ncbi:GntR family transcriptional regulator [Streptomyces mangrovisoli]|uniref:GntR family transcriptional regulator n=1 Tax=Streptomyces mangrovisoli TaxID=1428628 RepID=A0A1J4NNK5_9ACTN|nr:GntR family transcriptional regulator [Streptomyces mangrovisoli]OIJ63888.1 GntR family transcriptional regulator [Streptomyces mangrovisoli]
MTGPTPRRRPPTTQQFVLGELRAAITSGELKPGAPVRQDSLAERLGVSRLPLREALKTLEAEGLVRHEAHRGYFVAELSLADLREVYRLREILEAEAVRQASARLDDAALAELDDAQLRVESAAAAEDVAAMTAANRRFHFALYELSDMPRLVRLIATLWDATDAYRALYYADTARREHVLTEHRAILRALRAGRSDDAVRLLDEHRGHAVDVLEHILGQD